MEAVEKLQDDLAEKLASQLPRPSGYRLLIELPSPKEKTDGGLYKAKSTMKDEEVGAICGRVIDKGPDAYCDKSRFPNGPYCEIGDWILMRAYSGTRFQFGGKEWRLLNDDSVAAVVKDPAGIARI